MKLPRLTFSSFPFQSAVLKSVMQSPIDMKQKSVFWQKVICKHMHTHTYRHTHTQETNPQQRQQGPKFHFSTPVSEQERSIKCNYPENAAVTPCYTLTYEKHLNCIKNYDSNMDSVTVHIVFKVKLSFHDAT